MQLVQGLTQQVVLDLFRSACLRPSSANMRNSSFWTPAMRSHLANTVETLRTLIGSGKLLLR